MDKIFDRRKDPYFKVDNTLIEREDFNIFEKMVYIVLCKYAGNSDQAFPSYLTISKKVGCSRRKAIDAVNSLIRKGVLQKEIRKNDKSENISNLYGIIGVSDVLDGSAQHALPSAQHAPGSSAQHALPSAQHAPKKQTHIKTQYITKNTTTNPQEETIENNDVVVKPNTKNLAPNISNNDNFPIPNKEEIKILKNNIDNLTGGSITIVGLKGLIKKCGIDKVKEYINIYPKLAKLNELRDPIGFFIKAVQNDYKPIIQTTQNNGMVKQLDAYKFQQRQYTEEELDSLADDIDGE